jgi:hypothetical protein
VSSGSQLLMQCSLNLVSMELFCRLWCNCMEDFVFSNTKVMVLSTGTIE